MRCIPSNLATNLSHLVNETIGSADAALDTGEVGGGGGGGGGGGIGGDGGGGGGVMFTVEMVLYSRVAAIICVAGIIGNILNITVLTRRRLQADLTSMERTVYLGLATLAISDMMFCACALPHAWVTPRKFSFHEKNFEFYYTVYSDGLINIFVMLSTWLTVAMATSRYVAICHPLKARCLISGCRAKISILAIFILCVICNLPRFWSENIDTMSCKGGWEVYFRSKSTLNGRPTLRTLYMSVYFVLASVIPFLSLVYCNAKLVKALRHSLGFRGPGIHSAAGSAQVDTHRTSLTLILIVVMYLLLVLPAEVANFVRLVVIDTPSLTSVYNVVLAVLNVMQASNFSFHFVLYCVVNVHFRHSMKSVFACEKPRADQTIVLHDCEQVIALTNGETTGATLM